MQRSRELEVAGVARDPARLLVAVEARRRAADDVAWTGRPLVERVLLDERPDLLVPALDLLLRLDQSRHVEIASSIRGYVPQRQRFPAIPCRICSLVG